MKIPNTVTDFRAGKAETLAMTYARAKAERDKQKRIMAEAKVALKAIGFDEFGRRSAEKKP